MKKIVREVNEIKMSQSEANLFKDKLVNALCQGKLHQKEDAEHFANAIVPEMENIFNAAEAAFPIKKDILEILKSISKVQVELKKLRVKSECSGFLDALTSVVSRNIGLAKDGCAGINVTTLEELFNNLYDSAKHERFNKTATGVDIRLALEITYAVAVFYRKFLGRMPGITGEGKLDLDGDVSDKSTPYMRVCSIISETFVVSIARTAMKRAVESLEQGRPPTKYFKPDVIHSAKNTS